MRARRRVNGAWEDSTLAGYARVGNAWVEFGPPSAAIVDEAFTFNTPDTLDITDNALVNLGIVWNTSATGLWVGVQMYTASTPSGNIVASGYNYATTVELAQGTIAAPSGGLANIMFTNPVQVNPGTDYLAAVHCMRFVYSDGGSEAWPVTTTRLSTLNANPGKWAYNDFPVMPNNFTTAHYHVSPIVRFTA